MHKDLREIHIIGRHSREWLLGAQTCPAMNACGLFHAGWTDALWGYRFVRRNPPFSGIIVCETGHGQVWQDDRWLDCGPGTAYLLPRGSPHAYFANRRGTWRICWVAFSPASDMPLPSGLPGIVAVDPRPLRSAIDGLQREVSGPADLAAIQRWTELINLYARRIAAPTGEDARLGPLWEHIDADLSHSWSLPELADRAGISGEHLRRLCHMRLHRSPIQHLTHLRMRRAATLLVSTSQKVANIARMVGYDNAFAFSAAFTRHIGVSPKAYRATRIKAMRQSNVASVVDQ